MTFKSKRGIPIEYLRELNMYLTEFQKKFLEKESKKQNLSERDKKRIAVMLLCGEGKTQKEICEVVKCAPTTARHWMRVVKDGQAHRWRDFRQDGRPLKIEGHHLARLIALLRQQPQELGFRLLEEWTAKALQKQLFKEFGTKVSERHINRVLKKAGFSTRSRPKAESDQANLSRQRKLVIQDLPDSTNSNFFQSPFS
jgi:transposase